MEEFIYTEIIIFDVDRKHADAGGGWETGNLFEVAYK